MASTAYISFHKISTIIHRTHHAKQDSKFLQGLSLKQSFLPHTAITSGKTSASLKKKMLNLIGLTHCETKCVASQTSTTLATRLRTIKTNSIIDRVSTMARVNSIIKLSFTQGKLMYYRLRSNFIITFRLQKNGWASIKYKKVG